MKEAKKNPYKLARILRICVSLFIFCAISAQFLDVYHRLPNFYYDLNPAKTQFIPSLLNMLATGAVISGAAFIAFIVITLLFGRAYCSFICPFGTLMDICAKIAKYPSVNKFTKNTRLGRFCRDKFAKRKYAKARNFLRTFFTLLAVLAIVFGFSALLGLIEPYSLFGKVMIVAGHASSNAGADLLSATLSNYGIYSVHPVNGDVSIAIAAFGFSLFILFAISIASALKGRIYCNTLCPAGGFLGGLAKFAIFKLKLDKDTCVSCGKCSLVCKAQCIDSKNKTLDFTRCVLCFDCVNQCPKSSLGISAKNKIENFSNKKNDSKKENPIKRRDFIKTSPALATLMLPRRKRNRNQGSSDFPIIDGATEFGLKAHRVDKRLTFPPGAKSGENFLSKCTACQICVATCPSHILKPSITEWSLAGFMQPFMDFDAGFCVHACNQCSKICPTGAIQPITEEKKLTEKIGTAVFLKRFCVVHTDQTDCAACGEHCPVSAIEMIPHNLEKHLYLPYVHEEVCIGCGACEHICPVIGNKAIVVQGLEVHRQSKVFEQSMRRYIPQETKPAETPKPLDNPFPF